MRLYFGCALRISTSTTMVFCILVETTSPIFSLRCDSLFLLVVVSVIVSALLPFSGARRCPFGGTAARGLLRAGPARRFASGRGLLRGFLVRRLPRLLSHPLARFSPLVGAAHGP